MQILSQLINTVDQNPDSILVMRQQMEQRLPAHQHDKAQLLLVYGGIAYLHINIYFPNKKADSFYDELDIYPVSKLLADALL